ncbi:MAG: hypothetical protein ACE5F1_14580 [Planctomycetota bacterium]
MKRYLPGLVVLLPCLLQAQDDAVEASVSKARSADAGFEALHREFVKAKCDYMEKLNELVASEEYEKLREEGDYKGLRKLITKLKRPGKGFVERFAEAAKPYEGTKEELPFLRWIAQNAPKPERRRKAMRALLDRHIDKALWTELVAQTRVFGSEAPAILDRLIEKSPHQDVKIWARYTRCQMTLRDKGADAKSREKARAELQAIVADAPESTPALMIQAPEFKKGRLQIGMVAPDIQGEDVDGIRFRLSDYRGKVVVLDFWGDW